MNHGAAYGGKEPEIPVVHESPIETLPGDTTMSLPSTTALLARLDPSWKFVLWLMIMLRLVLGAVSIFLVRLGRPAAPAGYWSGLILGGIQPWNQVLSTWQRWDALWYQEIAEHGYRAANGTTAFYPLYPLLSRMISIPLAGNVVAAELLVSSIAFACAMWLLFDLARMDVGRAAAYMTVIVVALFPTGFYFLAPYSESLFLALTLASLWFARRGQPWLAGIAGFAAALTRAQGAFLILPLVFEYFRQRRERGQKPELDMFAALLPFAGWILFAVYVRTLSSSNSTPLSAEGLWSYTVVTPWEALSSSSQYISRTGNVPEILNLTCLIGFAFLAFSVSQRLPFAYSLYTWPLLALLFTRHMGYSPLMSVSRLVLMLFPCFILAASWLVRRPWVALSTVIVSVFLQMTLFTYFVYWYFIA